MTLTQKSVQEPLSSRKLELAPGEQAPFVLAFDAAPGDVGSGLRVELSPGDALAADDRAFLRVPAGRKLPVVLAPAKGSPWLERALSADPSVEALGASEASLNAGDVPADALVVIVGRCPRAIPGGDFVIVNPPAGECLGTIVGDSVERPTITSWADSDPRFRFLNLEESTFSERASWNPDGPRAALLRAREGTLVADVSVPGRSGTLIGFDPGETTWPLKASFVLFVRNLTELARAHRAGMVAGPARTGEPLRVRVPPEVSEVEIEAPDGKRVKVPARGGLVVAPSVDAAGFYFVTYPRRQHARAGQPDERRRERPHPALARPGAGSPHSTSSKVPDAVSGWAWLLAALALLLLTADIYFLTRTPRAPSRRDVPPPTRARTVMTPWLSAWLLPGSVLLAGAVLLLHVLRRARRRGQRAARCSFFSRWRASRSRCYRRSAGQGSSISPSFASSDLGSPSPPASCCWRSPRASNVSGSANIARDGLSSSSASSSGRSPLALALVGVEAGVPLDRMAVLVALDRSREHRPGARRREPHGRRAPGRRAGDGRKLT